MLGGLKLCDILHKVEKYTLNVNISTLVRGDDGTVDKSL